MKLVFTIPPAYDPNTLFSDTFGIIQDEPLDIVLHFSQKTAIYIRERIFADNQIIEELDDGSIILRFHACGREEIKRWILGFGTHVTVLEPDELRTEIKREINDMKIKYE